MNGESIWNMLLQANDLLKRDAEELKRQTAEAAKTLVLEADMKVSITEASKELFIAFFKDAINWNNQPLLDGNIVVTKEQRGNLTQLKVEGLATTENNGEFIWMQFTEKGIAYGRSLGLTWYD